MQLNNYVGYECDACGNVWEIEFRRVFPAPTCPECGVIQTDGPDSQYVIGDTEWEEGVYECYACGHTFSYQAMPHENPDEAPSCTHCGSDDVGQVY